MIVARGFGPPGLRYALVGVAILYFVMLVKHPDQKTLHAVGWFTEATCLFPRADVYATEYRIEGWSCSGNEWKPLDPTPYFPIQAEDKESRLQRVAHFYKRERTVMRALDEYVVTAHQQDPTSDGIPGDLGGIRLRQIEKPLPPPGGDVERYEFDPLSPIPADAKELFYAPKSLRKKRCEKTSPASP